MLPSVEHSGKGLSIDTDFVPRSSDQKDGGRVSSSDEHKARKCRKVKEKTEVDKKRHKPGQ